MLLFFGQQQLKAIRQVALLGQVSLALAAALVMVVGVFLLGSREARAQDLAPHKDIQAPAFGAPSLTKSTPPVMVPPTTTPSPLPSTGGDVSSPPSTGGSPPSLSSPGEGTSPSPTMGRGTSPVGSTPPPVHDPGPTPDPTPKPTTHHPPPAPGSPDPEWSFWPDLLDLAVVASPVVSEPPPSYYQHYYYTDHPNAPAPAETQPSTATIGTEPQPVPEQKVPAMSEASVPPGAETTPLGSTDKRAWQGFLLF